jgi:hypothetical protein
MDMDVENLRATEGECLRRFAEKAKALRAENPAMSAQVARAKAASSLPVTLEKYMWATSRLRFMGYQPVEWR